MMCITSKNGDSKVMKNIMMSGGDLPNEVTLINIIKNISFGTVDNAKNYIHDTFNKSEVSYFMPNPLDCMTSEDIIFWCTSLVLECANKLFTPWDNESKITFIMNVVSDCVNIDDYHNLLYNMIIVSLPGECWENYPPNYNFSIYTDFYNCAVYILSRITEENKQIQLNTDDLDYIIKVICILHNNREYNTNGTLCNIAMVCYVYNLNYEDVLKLFVETINVYENLKLEIVNIIARRNKIDVAEINDDIYTHALKILIEECFEQIGHPITTSED